MNNELRNIENLKRNEKIFIDQKINFMIDITFEQIVFFNFVDE